LAAETIGSLTTYITEASNMMVYCVMCIDEDDQGCCVHIFSTQEKAGAFADADPRDHVLYDYLVDHPERMEQTSQ
jgi:hypothetical protein